MKLRAGLSGLALGLLAFCSPGQIHAQGTFNRTITFDGPPVIPPGSGILVTYYYEDSMTFRPLPLYGDDRFSREGGGWNSFRKTAPLTYCRVHLTLWQATGNSVPPSHFGLFSVDLAEFSTLYPYPQTVQFIG